MNYLRQKALEFQLNPPAVLAVGFLSLILMGTILLNLPIASKTGEKIGFINALFTASSAVCVTGLVVVDTAEFWSLYGQIVIIILIQMGGLGFMTMATSVALLLGKKIRLKERLVIKEQLNHANMRGLVRLTRYIIYATFIIEILGALILSLRFIPMYGSVNGIWFSIFHSISAFCNAGFDIMGNSLVPFVGDGLFNTVIAFLVILGGLGFSVYIDIYRNRRFKKLSLHSKIVITMTVLLLLVGTIGILIIEYDNKHTLLGLNIKTKLLASFFQSSMTRTAGFNSLDLNSLKDNSIFLMMILAFIGGSPASTAGGIKTTTFGVLILTTFAIIKGEKDVVAFNRRISYELVNRSLAIIMIALTIILFVSFTISIIEEMELLDVMLETTSAFTTVGLTRGITSSLSNMSKVLIMCTMYIGRVGALTMAFAFGKKRKHKAYREAEENIMIG